MRCEGRERRQAGAWGLGLYHLQRLIVIADFKRLGRLHAQAKGRHGQRHACCVCVKKGSNWHAP